VGRLEALDEAAVGRAVEGGAEIGKRVDGRIRGVLARIGGQDTEITARAVILATGGIGGLYAVTTTPAPVQGRKAATAQITAPASAGVAVGRAARGLDARCQAGSAARPARG